ncbi:glycosyltransferase family 2 protein [Verrucomicrobiota bacterium sgz303538]
MKQVSIIIPVYNRAATLPRCINSVLGQTVSDWELIAVDDHSRDDSTKVIESFGDPRIKVLRHEQNGGAGVARNTGMKAAQGTYIAFLDSDDEWLPAKLERQIAALEQTGAGLCLCDFEEIGTDGSRVVHRPSADADWSVRLHTVCGVRGGTTPIFRRECLDQVGLMDESLRVLEDWDWLLRFAQKYPFTTVSEVLACAYAGGPRSPHVVAECTERFLEKHDADLDKVSAEHRSRVRSQHYQNVATNAFEARQHGLGARYLLKSFRCFPRQNPLRLAALFLAPVDHFFGTSLIQRGAAWQQQLLQLARGTTNFGA